ncbi:hypothetical protein Kpol_1033p19 [Vanderwaltozyma polyspora DSM 70294]|uniref:RWD domain-containing protein n=1 Tax=Vanderwaltozyma polyspora (strain ATCC 22028 / DSM 70294 / BCRC 21397 / CBS 2163 / NBRC 10782 / NRRL Y-8283 / UCD 57-17) TaxID=436907 RepID=A7TJ16_VANPO|nr:uncharacterized protein Kpol_1033p19 [Vanderwaltozyma polyspora DSM 70294]EDO17715.1 hypothetical protein Kpol_1033p19 [Vanderwaltozyma polyspora DSM 70294]
MAGFVGDNPYESPTFGKSLSLRVDGGFNAISINPSGRDVVLASRKGLYIIDLDDPFSPPRWLHHITPWQVADVQWSPHPAKPNWVVSTSNQKAIIWDLARSSSNSIEHVIHAHFRAITDINFNRQHPDILATCSIDTYIHAWDLRSPNRPYYSTSEWRSGASQVKWNFIDPNILASSHGNDVCIWDLRNGSTPLCKLLGHTSSVNSVDFNRFKKSEIMTCSNDGTVKFWDYSVNSDTCKYSINTDFPIWRGRYLPFGEGCCLMPMVGGENSVYMLSLKDIELECNEDKVIPFNPIYTYKGHSDRVIDFIWRSRHQYDSVVDDREFQLVTLSKDCDLRLWPINDDIYKKVDFKQGRKLDKPLPNYEYNTHNIEPAVTKKVLKDNYKRIKEDFVGTSGLPNSNDVNHINWLSGVRINDNVTTDHFFKERKFQNLGEEVSSIGHKFPKVVFEKISVSTGELVIMLRGPWLESNPEDFIFIRLQVSLPSNYPNKNNQPIFTIEENSKLTEAKRKELSSTLKEISQQYTDLGLYCLEPCLRFVLGEKVDLEDIENKEAQFMNFELPDVVYDDLSSINSSDYITSSSETEEDDINKTFAETENTNDMRFLGRDITFDSTPVPNESGMVWTASGQLLCFFAGESTIDKKSNVLGIVKTQSLKQHKNNQEVKQSTKNDAFKDEPSQRISSRPKRYVDTIITPTRSKEANATTDDEELSDDSSDSFVDDWDEFLRSDRILKNNLPHIHGNFRNVFNTGYGASSTKTAESIKSTRNIIKMLDYSFLIPEKRELALEYQFFDKNSEDMARNNALIAEKYGCEEISHCWQILSDYLMSQGEDDPYNVAWDIHPMGIKWFVKEAIRYFEKQNNLQMLAMISCILANPRASFLDEKVSKENNITADKRVESIISFPAQRNMDDWKNDINSQKSISNMTSNLSDVHPRLKKNQSPDIYSIQSEDYFNFRNNQSSNRRAGLWGNELSGNNISSSMTPTLHIPTRVPEIKVELIHDEILDVIDSETNSLIDDEDAFRMKVYIYNYANLLFRWGLPIERAQILKIQIGSKDLKNTKNSYMYTKQFDGINTTWVNNQKSEFNTVRNCCFCNLKLTRSIFNCGNCQHVMHSYCAKEWWNSSNECPSGCGCICPDTFDIN